MMNKNYSKLLIVFAYVILMTLIVFLLNGKSIIGVDDANIYFVYMRNFADGHGLVYNIGGERVEGFTSLLWTLIGSFFYLITRNPQLLLLIFNILIITFTFWKLIVFVDNKTGNEKLFSTASFLLLGLISIYPGYFEWAVISLLETGLWSSIIILLFLNLLTLNENNPKSKVHWEFNILLFLLILCRPESLVWGILFVTVRIYQLLRNGNAVSNRFSLIAISLSIFIITNLLLVLWRMYYFGYPLPNTYYAKMTGNVFDNFISGSGYLYRFLIGYPVALLGYFISFFAIVKLKRENNSRDLNSLLIVLSASITTLFILLYTGGDHFNLSRFIQPVVPMIWLLLILSVLSLKLEVFKIKYILPFLFMVIFTGETSWMKYAYDLKRFIAHEWDIANTGMTTSSKLNTFFSPMAKLPTQGVGAAGASAYYYHGFTYDLLGLNNIEMAHSPKTGNYHIMKNHQSFNKKIFLKQHPDLFIFGGTFIGKESEKEFKGLIVVPFIRNIYKNILFDSDFKKNYSNVLIQRKDYPECLAVFASNSFIKTIDTNIFKVKIYPHVIEP